MTTFLRAIIFKAENISQFRLFKKSTHLIILHYGILCQFCKAKGLSI